MGERRVRESHCGCAQRDPLNEVGYKQRSVKKGLDRQPDPGTKQRARARQQEAAPGRAEPPGCQTQICSPGWTPVLPAGAGSRTVGQIPLGHSPGPRLLSGPRDPHSAQSRLQPLPRRDSNQQLHNTSRDELLTSAFRSPLSDTSVDVMSSVPSLRAPSGPRIASDPSSSAPSSSTAVSFIATLSDPIPT